MPDLEKKITQWRRQMRVGGVKTPAVLDELESHLREELRARLAVGDSEVEAFQTAVWRIGSADSLRVEFNKISGGVSLPALIGMSLWLGAVMLMLALFSGRLVTGRMGVLLFTHILTLTSGYLAAFLAGALAVCYVYFRRAGKLSPVLEHALNRAVSRFTYIAGTLVVAGFLLGMYWTRKYRGAAWRNDPREIGTLCVCLWFVVLWFAHAFGKVSSHARMLLSIMGNIIVAQAWFGAGILAGNPALHWYGVAKYLPLQLFMGAHLLFLLMGFSRKCETAAS